jgi:hypothetical protein
MAAFLVICITSGCISASSKELYKNPEAGVSLEKRTDWDVAYYSRNGKIVLESGNENKREGSARVEIGGSACSAHLPSTPEEQIKLHMDRIRILYNLPSVTVVQEPTQIEIGGYKTINAIILVPTMALSKDAIANQVGVQSPEVFQTIAIFAIEDNNHNSAMAYIYKGNNETLNAQAQEIVDSIRITCAAKP